MLILTDLDDTLFQTTRKCPANAGDLLAMSFLVDGAESGYATTRQQRTLTWLSTGQVVPVTARDRDVLARVNINQAPAICANGGCVIDKDGQVDQHWHDILKERASKDTAVRAVYDAATATLNTQEFRHWIVTEGDLDLYIVIKSNTDDAGASLADLEATLSCDLPTGWRVHRNGNNLAFLPPWLNKREAARYLIEKFRDEDTHLPVVGIGDSHSDVGFMDLCDFAMTPTSSQLWQHVTSNNAWC
ncbi:sucrose-6-phosphate hydrolase [Novosphingobium profundi]|uniref:HAD family hydrolase n=1 Tax=Novosphingobium profundi TaxID=1774954 RepID=UPI001BD9DDAA|nr:HAD family hydrolase [Novosphingobium profundi]MBT0671473.1 sucrose-6-phosphate hydrolase [Novosphingobium profundi]